MNHKKLVMTSNKLFFKEKSSLSEKSLQSFLDKVSLPKLNDDQALECEGVINEHEFLKALTSCFWIMIKRQGRMVLQKNFM